MDTRCVDSMKEDSKDREVIILGGARDFHAMDWYRAIRRNCPGRNVVFLTDLFGGEGFHNLAKPGDRIENLLIIDRFLCTAPSALANYWRNLVKMLASPIQAAKLRLRIRNSNCNVVHAHPMYYMFLCWMARVPYIGTPQGDEILVRPNRSRAYRYLAAKILRGAKAVTVDSIQMRNGIKQISGVDAIVVQNGINAGEIRRHGQGQIVRSKVTSVRGIEKLYRIKEVILSRNKLAPDVQLTLIYPFYDSQYLQAIRGLLGPHDSDLGRLDKDRMYRLMHESTLVISIPSSDSSPRSVYEAIFAGCCVAVTRNTWIDLLPECMRVRVYVADLDNEAWFTEALDYARLVTQEPFSPTEEALDLFDENRSLKLIVEKFY